MKFMLGVDEAGRGPLAGPVAVGIVAVSERFDVAREFQGVADSKRISEKKREKIFEMLEKRAEQGEVRFTVEFESAEMIDREGIAPSIRRALAPDATLVRVQLDGALRAPSKYAQETIIHGDVLVPLISLASIAAKVARDRLMVALAAQYPHYGFEKHKGYGTKAHYEMLKTHGRCAIHRLSFLHVDFPVE